MRLLPLCILLGATGAHADVLQRAQRLFEVQCASCHTLDASQRARPDRAVDRGKLDLSRIFSSREELALRRWLFNPSRVKADSACGSRLVTPVEQDGMLQLLKTRSQPPQTPVVPPLSGRQPGQTITREKPAAVLVTPSPRAPLLVDPPPPPRQPVPPSSGPPLHVESLKTRYLPTTSDDGKTLPARRPAAAQHNLANGRGGRGGNGTAVDE